MPPSRLGGAEAAKPKAHVTALHEVVGASLSKGFQRVCDSLGIRYGHVPFRVGI